MKLVITLVDDNDKDVDTVEVDYEDPSEALDEFERLKQSGDVESEDDGEDPDSD